MSSNSKTKSVLTVIVIVLLTVFLLGSIVSLVGIKHDWFGTSAKSVPTSPYNMAITSYDEILGVEIERKDFPYFYSSYEISLEEKETEGIPLDMNVEYASMILSVDGYGEQFNYLPEGVYTMVFKINGVEYVQTNVEYRNESSENGLCAMTQIINEAPQEGEANLSAYKGRGYVILMAKHICYDYIAGVTGNGASIIINNINDATIETFEFVSYERTGDLITE